MALITALSNNDAMTLAQQEAFLDAAIAGYGLPPPATGAAAVVTWIPPSSGSSGSNVYQGTSVAGLTKVATLAGGIASWTSPPLPAGTYYFAVTNLSTATLAVESGQSASAALVITPAGVAMPECLRYSPSQSRCHNQPDIEPDLIRNLGSS
jgi:hypothetical protein